MTSLHPPHNEFVPPTKSVRPSTVKQLARYDLELPKSATPSDIKAHLTEVQEVPGRSRATPINYRKRRLIGLAAISSMLLIAAAITVPVVVTRLNAVTTKTATMMTTTSSTTTTATTTSTSSSTSTTSTATTTTVTAVLSQSGVQLNVDPALLPSGWSLCYNATYTASMSSSDLVTILGTCAKNKLLLGCRPVGSTILTVAAMGSRSSVLYNCGSTTSCSYLDNGVAWYYSNSYSWGFAQGGDTVARGSCDTASTNAGYRLCWHTQGSGGYRCGATLGLNSDTTWEKVIYQAT